MSYFKNSFIISLLGLILAYFVDGFTAVWITLVLAILEVSLSFDNAVVNAQVLKTMDATWQHRFITWGMAIAVFGMRFVFPILIVSIAIGINPWAAFMLALDSPNDYQHALESVHVSVMGFGGVFLMMVATNFFIDAEKEVHWFESIENKMSSAGSMPALKILKFEINGVSSLVTLLIVLVTAKVILNLHGTSEALSFIYSSIAGMVTYYLVDSIEGFLGVEESSVSTAKSGLASFIYLEVLDSSFSFDGVLGALALSNNIFIIAIGLGIGALFVRSLTIMMVEKGTVDQFIYLEHGAFYAIFGLASIMFINTVYEIPESVTGLLGAAFIVASVMSSIKYNKSNI